MSWKRGYSLICLFTDGENYYTLSKPCLMLEVVWELKGEPPSPGMHKREVKMKHLSLLCYPLPTLAPPPPFKLGAKEIWRYSWTWIKERLLVGEMEDEEVREEGELKWKEEGWGGGWGEIFKSHPPAPPSGDTRGVSRSTTSTLRTTHNSVFNHTGEQIKSQTLFKCHCRSWGKVLKLCSSWFHAEIYTRKLYIYIFICCIIILKEEVQKQIVLWRLKARNVTYSLWSCLCSLCFPTLVAPWTSGRVRCVQGPI